MKLPKTFKSKNGRLTVTIDKTSSKEMVRFVLWMSILMFLVYFFIR